MQIKMKKKIKDKRIIAAVLPSPSNVATEVIRKLGNFKFVQTQT